VANKKDSNDVLESLRQVQEHVARLNASIARMKGIQNESTGT
jgi:hypothetical protein